jgi:hypothetical protein
VTNPKVARQRIQWDRRGPGSPKHDTRGEALMMTAISAIASVLLPAF